MSQNTFNVYVMSYKRSNCIKTQKLLEYCTYVVREEEAELYRNAGVKNILPIPKGSVSNFMNTFYWIIENTPEDVICILDDDIKFFQYRLDCVEKFIIDNNLPDIEKASSEMERIGQLLLDLDLGFAFDNPTPIPKIYDKEFGFTGMPGHIRWVNKKCFKAKLDETDLASSDIDMAMQEVLYNRIILFPKYFCSNAVMDKNEGERNLRQAHIDLQHSMVNKWGKYYSYNFKKNVPKINVSR